MSVAEILGAPLLTLAFCWRLERRDGVTIGLTSHDRDVSVGGLTYRAAPGLVPSAISSSAELEPGTMDLGGAISVEALSAGDLMAGRWDGAALWLHLTQWEAPGDLWLELARGTLGAVEREGGGFTAELQGPEAVLGRAVAPSTSPSCRAELGDPACGVDMAGRQRVVTVTGVDERLVTIDAGDLEPGDYAFGSLRWLSGRNRGLVAGILASDADGVELEMAPPFAVEAGARALIRQGCDRRMESCGGRFGNAANFRGEAFLPGNDLLTRYPGG